MEPMMDNTNLNAEVQKVMGEVAGVSGTLSGLISKLLDQSNYRMMKWDETARQVFRLEAALNSANHQNRELREQLAAATERADLYRDEVTATNNEHNIAHENAIDNVMTWMTKHSPTQPVAPECVKDLLSEVLDAYGTHELFTTRFEQRFEQGDGTEKRVTESVTQQAVTNQVTDNGANPDYQDETPPDIDAVAKAIADAAHKVFGNGATITVHTYKRS